MTFPWLRYVIGQSPDGWVVLFATNGHQSDDEIMACALENVEFRQVDPATVRLVHHRTATEEELDILMNFLDVMLARHRRGER